MVVDVAVMRESLGPNALLWLITFAGGNYRISLHRSGIVCRSFRIRSLKQLVHFENTAHLCFLADGIFDMVEVLGDPDGDWVTDRKEWGDNPAAARDNNNDGLPDYLDPLFPYSQRLYLPVIAK